MFWVVIVILFFLIMGVMELGEKEKSSYKSQNSQSYRETKSELGRSINEGLATFNAGLKKFNEELKIKNQATELLSDFYVKNRTVVVHYECLVKYVEMTEKYSRNVKVTSVRDFLDESEKLLNSFSEDNSSFSSKGILLNNGYLPAVKKTTDFISPLEDRNFEHYEKPMLGSFNKNNEELKTALLEKIMEIIDERKSDLQRLFRRISYCNSKILFDGLLEDLGEKELFYRLFEI